MAKFKYKMATFISDTTDASNSFDKNLSQPNTKLEYVTKRSRRRFPISSSMRLSMIKNRKSSINKTIDKTNKFLKKIIQSEIKPDTSKTHDESALKMKNLIRNENDVQVEKLGSFFHHFSLSNFI